MSRPEAENSHAISIFLIKQWGYLPQGFSHRSGTLTWTRHGEESSVGVSVVVGKDIEGCMRLRYTHTSNWTREETKLDYEVSIVTTPCHYGGVRYWFICPLTKNGYPCGRRVGVLYIAGRYYGCRHCHNIAYLAQLEGGRYRMGAVNEPALERAYKAIKRKYYCGRPTRKYRCYMRLRIKMNNNWARALARFGNIF